MGEYEPSVGTIRTYDWLKRKFLENIFVYENITVQNFVPLYYGISIKCNNLHYIKSILKININVCARNFIFEFDGL